MVAPPRRATLADLANTPDDGRRYELIDGELIVSAAPSWQHQAVVNELQFLLNVWTREHRLGAVRAAPVDVVLDDAAPTAVQPDIVYASRSLLGSVRDGRFYGSPDLVVEVLSPTSRTYDTVRKLFVYARAGVPEYWIANPEARTIDIHTLQGGEYVTPAPDSDGRIASTVLPGLIIDPITIFAQALADNVE